MREQLLEKVGGGLQAILALYRSGSEFRRLLDELPAGAYTCAPDGLITYFNQHAVRLWGRAPKLNDPSDRFCGSFKLFASDGSPIKHDQCWMALALQLRKEYNGHEIVIERPDGERLTALAHANPIIDEDGKLLGAVNVLVDISDRKRMEDALNQADRAKNEFLATLAHELRNPLAPIRNAVHILQLQGSRTKDARSAVEVIDRQLQYMTRLVDDLMDISRITSNKLTLRKERVELAAMLRAAVEASQPLFDAGGQEFALSMPPQPIYLNADPTRLAQAIANLLNNAAKYTDRGGRVWLTAEREGSTAMVMVRDTGIGIASDMLPHIFDMFTQVDRSLARAQGGLGVGLTVAKRLVELHGGSIAARSPGIGKGSEFVIRLALAKEASELVPPVRRQASPGAVASPLRVLVVDDNRDAVTTLGMLLRMLGNEVRTAADGVEAVALAEAFRPDVTLLDIGLPKLDGYAAAQSIRRRSWGAGMVLIALTGWGQEVDKRRSQEAGFDQHLVKPVDPATLIQLLASFEHGGTDPEANGSRM